MCIPFSCLVLQFSLRLYSSRIIQAETICNRTREELELPVKVFVVHWSVPIGWRWIADQGHDDLQRRKSDWLEWMTTTASEQKMKLENQRFLVTAQMQGKAAEGSPSVQSDWHLRWDPDRESSSSFPLRRLPIEDACICLSQTREWLSKLNLC